MAPNGDPLGTHSPDVGGGNGDVTLKDILDALKLIGHLLKGVTEAIAVLEHGGGVGKGVDPYPKFDLKCLVEILDIWNGQIRNPLGGMGNLDPSGGPQPPG